MVEFFSIIMISLLGLLIFRIKKEKKETLKELELTLQQYELLQDQNAEYAGKLCKIQKILEK